MFQCGISRLATMALSAEPTSSSIRSATSTFVRVAQSLPALATSIRATSSTTELTSMTPKCTTAPMRKVTRDVNEDVRDRVRALANTEAFRQSRRDRAEPEAARQAPLPRPATAGSCLPGVSVASDTANDAAAPSNGARDKRTIKNQRPPHSQRNAEFCNTIPPKADGEQTSRDVGFVPIGDICGAPNCILFDHLVGACEQRVWDGQAERLGGFEINH